MAEEEKEDVVKTSKKEAKASKPVMPAIYKDEKINMHSSMITTKEAFITLFKGSKAARGTNLGKAFEKAKKWKDKH